MVLSTEQMDSLQARYDVLGLDTVRIEIERNVQTGLSPPDVTAFARAWIAVEEAKSQRTIRFVKILTAAVCSLLSGTIAVLLISKP